MVALVSTAMTATGGSSDMLNDWSVRRWWRRPNPAMPRSMMLEAICRSPNRSSIASARKRPSVRCRSPKYVVSLRQNHHRRRPGAQRALPARDGAGPCCHAPHPTSRWRGSYGSHPSSRSPSSAASPGQWMEQGEDDKDGVKAATCWTTTRSGRASRWPLSAPPLGPTACHHLGVSPLGQLVAG